MIDKLKTIVRVLNNDPKPFRRLSCKFLAWLPFDAGALFRLKLPSNGFRIHLRKSSLSLATLYDPNARKSDADFITSYLRSGNVYIDVGANIGTTAIPAALVMPHGHVVAFEPHPRIFGFLEENVKLNDLEGRVRLFNCALGESNGEISFSSGTNDDTNHVIRSRDGLCVPVHRLDDYTTEFSKIDLLKIDVEGYEKFVLKGGRKTVERASCVYFEISEEHFNEFGYTVKDLLAEFESAGFGLFIKNTDSQISRIGCDYQLTTHHTNVFAIRNVYDFLGRTCWTELESA
ncbi:FkbM family methyltransferase [Stieleria sp. ICT_E10.1]|uniref:FkbM family methyltransferase n=1 Tax=Stieleria sedimenti TaxID=2976331 RepID=UPI0021802700|nr:FkbM family methyltransferase [Stieleria sedimenti]MCS7466765.1 FkbM family methyltransferase [Stieleria sedimenti]